MSNIHAFISGAWTIAWVLVIHEGRLPFIGYILFGVAYIMHILVWINYYKEERNGK